MVLSLSISFWTWEEIGLTLNATIFASHAFASTTSDSVMGPTELHTKSQRTESHTRNEEGGRKEKREKEREGEGGGRSIT